MAKDKLEWIICGHNNAPDLPNCTSVNFDKYKVVASNGFLHKYKHLQIGIEGNIIAQNHIFKSYSHLTPIELIGSLFEKHGDKFINYVKGIFSIIILDSQKKQILLFNDHFGINKFFYSVSDNSETIISNKSSHVFKLDSLKKFSPENAIIYQLTNHFIGGISPYKHIHYSQPATKISLNSKFHLEKYFKHDDILIRKKKLGFSELENAFITSIKNNIEYHQPSEVYLTLTGGLDNRLTLSILEALKKKAVGITYGHEDSADVIVAQEIAQKLGITHKFFHFIPDKEWMEEQESKILSMDNYLINMHRAHRYATFEKFKEPGAMVFGGYAGGELLRNYFPDGIHITNFTHSWISEPNNKKRIQLLKNSIKEINAKDGTYNFDYIFDFFQKQSFSTKNTLLNKFHLTFELVLPLQHAQDIKISEQFFSTSIPIYFDIDIIKVVFASKYNFLWNNKMYFGNKQLISFKGPIPTCKIINNSSSTLANIILPKRGYYTPSEIVHDSFIKLFFKRYSRLKSNSPSIKYHPNFSLGDWFVEYAKNKIPELLASENTELDSIFDIESIQTEAFQNANSKPTESSWRPITNLISLSNILKHSN